ncbi:MAG: MBL fold metallo-hydrolase [Phycisphaerae bacterium]
MPDREKETNVLTFSLQSGSNGNSVYVEADGVRLLFDAGISGRQARQRMATYDRSIRDVDALLLTHDHADHICCAGIYQRLFGLPIYVTRPTYRVIRGQLGKLRDVRHFRAGESLSFGPVTVHTQPTPHDAVDGVIFVVESRRKRLGIFTDLGHPFEGLSELLEGVDAAYLESNYDPHLLAEGPYPADLKARIRGAGGHLSNEESAQLVRLCGRRHRWIALAHLSEQNNHPDVALQAHRSVLGGDQSLTVAGRYGVSALLRV